MLADELGAAEVLYLLPDLVGEVPDRRTVRELMLLADLVLLPSTEEGFGVPLQEAAALRVPVLCADIPVFREVGGAGAKYFGLDADPPAIAEQALAIASSPLNRNRRRPVSSLSCFRAQLKELVEAPWLIPS
jgi:glycosyltransferase involved in cell wall biosynthesis